MKQEIKAIRKLYEKQFLQLNKSDWTEAALKHAEAAEKETIRLNCLLMTADGVKETLAKRADRAEARIQELETEILKEAKYADGLYDDLHRAGYPVERSLVKRLKALAGEKTK